MTRPRPGPAARPRLHTLAALGLTVLMGAGLIGATAARAGKDADADTDWARYQALFVTDTGRVIDTGNSGVSHSEGQGWGLLLAEAHGDRAAFERIWAWTQANLAVRDDRLHAWRWLPESPETSQPETSQPHDPTPDLNNASDGDIYIAWALLRAHRRWDVQAWRASASAILHDLRACCVRQHAGHTVLLPGAHGFVRPDADSDTDALVLNPSYWVFPAFDAFARAFETPDETPGEAPMWAALTASGLDLLRQARFGRFNLPADWFRLEADGGTALAQGFPPRFSWDAIRVPLLLAWGGVDARDLYEPFVRYHRELEGYPFQPAFTNLDDDSLASFALDPGGLASLGLARRQHARLTKGTQPEIARPQIEIPGITVAHSYYTASLLALARLARTEGPR